jgi:hypothetical protein
MYWDCVSILACSLAVFSKASRKGLSPMYLYGEPRTRARLVVTHYIRQSVAVTSVQDLISHYCSQHLF